MSFVTESIYETINRILVYINWYKILSNGSTEQFENNKLWHKHYGINTNKGNKTWLTAKMKKRI